MRYKEAKPYFYEALQTECPHCGADYLDKDIGWREKQFDKEGRSYSLFRCHKTACNKLFKLRIKVEK